jgi:hypothetical protein
MLYWGSLNCKNQDKQKKMDKLVTNPDLIITASDSLINEENSYLTVKDIFDPDLILKAECFRIPGEKSYFIDLVLHLNRRYRRRLGTNERSVVQNGIKTRVFKREVGVFAALDGLKVKEITFYVGDGVMKRVEELQLHE